MDAHQLAHQFLTMAARIRISAALALALPTLALAAAGCGSIIGRRRSGADQAVERPTAVATLGRFTQGSRGQIWGYARRWPIEGHESLDETPDPSFTYVIDYQIVETSYIDKGVRMPTRAEGVRRIYFHPGGVRIALGDVSRCVNGEPIAVEQVRFTFEYLPGFAQVKLRMTVHQTSSRPFDYDGRTINPVAQRDQAFEMYGRYSAQYRGLLLTGTGT